MLNNDFEYRTTVMVHELNCTIEVTLNKPSLVKLRYNHLLITKNIEKQCINHMGCIIVNNDV
jgi:hypothetical protein